MAGDASEPLRMIRMVPVNLREEAVAPTPIGIMAVVHAGHPALIMAAVGLQLQIPVRE